MSRPFKVFISYSHDSVEHGDRVLVLANRLRTDGIDAVLDQYEPHPAEGWPRWMDRQIRDADYVIMVCNETYYKRVMGEEKPGIGLGVRWEGNLIYQHLYNAESYNSKFIPVIFEDGNRGYLPTPIQGVTYYQVNTEAGYVALYRQLTSQPEVLRRELGEIRSLPPREPKQESTWIKPYLEELAKQRPYALWNMETFVNRTIMKDKNPNSHSISNYRAQRNDLETQSNPEAIQNVLERDGKIVLLGEPGLGKTSLLLHLAWECASRVLALMESETAPEVVVPIYVELKYYNGEGDLESFLARRVNEILYARHLTIAAGARESASMIKKLLAQPSPRFLLLFDGLNEAPSQFHTSIIGMIQGLFNCKHCGVVTCRKTDYDESLSQYAPTYVLQDLGEAEICTFLDQEFGDEGGKFFDKQIAADEKMKTLAANPLLLWLLSVIAKDNSKGDLPTNKGKLFQQFIALMPKLRRGEGISTRVPFDLVISTLSSIAYKLQEAGQLTVELSTLRNWHPPTANYSLEEVLSQAKDWRFLKTGGLMGEPIEFLHQLLLEYFAAVYLDSELHKGSPLEEVLNDRIFNYSWHESIQMLVGINPQLTHILKWITKRVVSKKEYDGVVLLFGCIEALKTSDGSAESAVVSTLSLSLQDPDTGVREMAILLLGVMEDPRVPDLLISTLRDKEKSIRELAISHLPQTGSFKVIEPLISLLRDKDPKIRGAAAQALGATGDRRALKPLLEIIADKSSDVRYSAAIALGKMKDPQVINPLINLLKDNDSEVRWGGVKALQELDDIKVLPSLISSMADEDPQVQRAAIKSVQQKGSLVVPSLISAFDSEDEHLIHGVVCALVGIGESAIEPLLAALQDSKWRVRRGAAEVLGEMATESIFPLLKDDKINAWKIVRYKAVDQLTATLKDENIEVRRSVVNALKRAGDLQVVDPLIPLLHDKDLIVRRQVAEILGKSSGPEAVDPLISVMQDEDNTLRKNAIGALGEIGDLRALESLVKALSDTDSGVSWAAKGALKKIGSKAVEPLITRMGGEDGKLCSSISTVLAGIGLPAVEPLIITLKSGNKTARKWAAHALGEMGDSRSLEPLVTALQDDNANVRFSAAVGLRKISGFKPIEPLIAALRDGNPLVRYAVTGVLTDIGEPAVDYLLYALRNDNADIRKHAAHALGEIGDLRAAPELKRIVISDKGRALLGTVADEAQKALKKIQEKGQR